MTASYILTTLVSNFTQLNINSCPIRMHHTNLCNSIISTQPLRSLSVKNFFLYASSHVISMQASQTGSNTPAAGTFVLQSSFVCPKSSADSSRTPSIRRPYQRRVPTNARIYTNISLSSYKCLNFTVNKSNVPQIKSICTVEAAISL